MPYPPDRPIDEREITVAAYPLPPLNVNCQSPYIPHTCDIRWSSPSELSTNSKFQILGVNIYRSFDSEFGPFVRLNVYPIGTNFYRDRSQLTVAFQEDVSGRFFQRGLEGPDYGWAFRTQNAPLVIDGPLGEADCLSLNVQVLVDCEPAVVDRVVASTGEVSLSISPGFDVTAQVQTPAVLPKPGSVVLATYRYLRNDLKTDLDRKIFYRLTTVAYDVHAGNLIETPLDQTTGSHNKHVEQLDWVWKEAIRRNRFILVQGGERVKAFIRKTQGAKCQCYNIANRQPSSMCLVCFGTGIIGGYEGPYDMMVAPDDGPRNIQQSNRGRTFSHVYESWTGPSPLLSQRDFLVKLNGDRYAIGPVRMPSNRGMLLQQFFPVSHIDEQDVRYMVPVLDTTQLRFPQTRWQVPGEGRSTPMITERSTIPDDREFRGNTVAYENTNRR